MLDKKILNLIYDFSCNEPGFLKFLKEEGFEDLIDTKNKHIIEENSEITLYSKIGRFLVSVIN